MRYAFERQGWRVAFANDIDPKKLAYVCAIISEIDSQLPTSIRESGLVPSVSLATASFPCTDLSLAGGRKVWQDAFFGLLGISGRSEGHGSTVGLLSS